MVLSKWKTAQVVLAAYTPLLVVVQSGLPAFAISFYLSHPWKLMLATFALPIFTLIYTKPDSPLRLVVLPFVALGAVCYHATSGSIMPNRAIAAALDGPFMLLFLISVDALVLQRLHLAKDGTEKTGTSSRKEVSGRRAELDAHSRTEISSFWCAVAWAFHIIFSYRAIGSQREAKNIPKFSYSDPNFVPARSSLLLQRGFAIIIGFLFVDFVTHQPSPRSELFPPHNASLFPAMSDFTVESITIRVFSTLFFWTTLHITISLIYNAVSFIGLATFLTSPADWPPYFGSAKEAYTLRRFWGYATRITGSRISSDRSYLEYSGTVVSATRSSALPSSSPMMFCGYLGKPLWHAMSTSSSPLPSQVLYISSSMIRAVSLRRKTLFIFSSLCRLWVS